MSLTQDWSPRQKSVIDDQIGAYDALRGACLVAFSDPSRGALKASCGHRVIYPFVPFVFFVKYRIPIQRSRSGVVAMRLVAMRIHDGKDGKDVKDAADRLYMQGRSYVLQRSERVHGPTPPRIMTMSDIAQWFDDHPEQIMAAVDGA